MILWFLLYLLQFHGSFLRSKTARISPFDPLFAILLQVDPYCTNIWNDASYISSKDGCKEVHERCPAAALDQCAVRSDYCTEWHETLEYKDCDGDAYLDPVCTNSVNDGISIYRSAELPGSVSVLSLFFLISTPSWGD